MSHSLTLNTLPGLVVGTEGEATVRGRTLIRASGGCAAGLN